MYSSMKQIKQSSRTQNNIVPVLPIYVLLAITPPKGENSKKFQMSSDKTILSILLRKSH